MTDYAEGKVQGLRRHAEEQMRAARAAYERDTDEKLADNPTPAEWQMVTDHLRVLDARETLRKLERKAAASRRRAGH